MVMGSKSDKQANALASALRQRSQSVFARMTRCFLIPADKKASSILAGTPHHCANDIRLRPQTFVETQLLQQWYNS